MTAGLSPLRRVIVSQWPINHQEVTMLACGHMLSPAQDSRGYRYPSRRRCYKCKAGARRDFEPIAFEEGLTP
jgi:hypothetical protein